MENFYTTPNDEIVEKILQLKHKESVDFYGCNDVESIEFLRYHDFIFIFERLHYEDKCMASKSYVEALVHDLKGQ
jgi:hypothetical protein